MRTLSLLLLCVGCATSSSKFTRPDELEQIARDTVAPVPARKIAHLTSWALEHPLPERIEHVALTGTDTPVTQLALTAAAGRFRLTRDLTCIADERARIALAYDGAEPGLVLSAFIEARCGSPSHHVRVWNLFGETRETETDDALITRWAESLTTGLAAIPAGATAGIALRRGGKKAHLAVAFSVDPARFEPISIYAEDGVVRVRGSMLNPTERVWGEINQGEDDSAPCVANPAVQLPDFELACPVRPGSPHDWVGIWSRAPGRFLGDTVLTAMVFSHRAPSPTFVNPTLGQQRDGSPQAFLEALNAQRSKMGRAPMTLSSPQTDVAKSLVPPYVAAQVRGDPLRADRIALGLIAGWRVEGAVTDGWFTSSEVPADAAPELLAALLELPGGRSQLLARGSHVLALGQLDNGGVTDSLVCTYSLLDEPQPSVERQRALFEQLNAERKRRGRARRSGCSCPARRPRRWRRRCAPAR
ncbi:MAG: hypothetical protein IPJ65_25210 [Archangiaceae bacterium]|nr:hypothetical protein [Archangiaceae bacterium]